MRRISLLGLPMFLFTIDILFASSIYLFDMGTESSPVWQGFKQVTPQTIYTPEKGYGWKKTSGRAVDRGFPDALYGDFVLGPGEFCVDLPEGKYKVKLVMRDFFSIPKRDYCVIAEGQVKVDTHIESKFYLGVYYQYLNYFCRKDGPGLWEKCAQLPFSPFTHTFSIEVKDGQLNLEFSPNCCINLAIIYPEEIAENVERMLEKLEFARKEAFYNLYTQKEYEEEKKPVLEGKPSDKEKGYILFARPYLKNVYPYTIPRPDERKATVGIFATPGEREPVTFSVYPLVDLKGVKVTLTDIQNEKGQKILKENIDIYKVEYLEKISGFTYSIEPSALVKFKEIDIPSGFTTTFWLTVKVPEKISPGIYQGKIIFSPRERPSAGLTLKVRVLPFILEEPEDLATGFFTWSLTLPEGYFIDQKEKYFELLKKYIQYMRDLGCTLIAWGPHSHHPHHIFATDGSVQVDFSRNGGYFAFNPGGWESFMKIVKEVGGFKYFVAHFGVFPEYCFRPPDFNYPVFSPQFNDAYKELTRQIRDKFKREGWPKLIIMVHDEPREYEVSSVDPNWLRVGRNLETMKKLLGLLHDVKGIQTTITLGDDEYLPLVPLLDIPWPHGWDRSKKIREETHKLGKTLWLYNDGMNRYAFGFYNWIRGAKGHTQFELAANFFESWQAYDTAVFFSPEGPLPRPCGEQVREGIDDYKYISLLEKRIEEAKDKNISKEKIEKAEDLLKEIKCIEEGEVKDKPNLDPWGTDFTKHFMEKFSDRLDTYRWRIAEAIMEIDNELKGR